MMEVFPNWVRNDDLPPGRDCWQTAQFTTHSVASAFPTHVGKAFAGLVCLEKIGPFLKRGREGERNGEIYGTSAIYAGADYREAA